MIVETTDGREAGKFRNDRNTIREEKEKILCVLSVLLAA